MLNGTFRASHGPFWRETAVPGNLGRRQASGAVYGILNARSNDFGRHPDGDCLKFG